jgi:hypothetical protein
MVCRERERYSLSGYSRYGIKKDGTVRVWNRRSSPPCVKNRQSGFDYVVVLKV